MSARHNQPPDRLAAILAELDEGRRTPWVPAEDEIIDRRPLWPRRRGRAEQTSTQTQGLEALPFASDPVDRDEPEPTSRADRRARGLPGRDIQPHTPLFRSPLPDTEIESHPGRSALTGALVVLVVVAAVFGFRVWSARSSSEPVPLAGAAGAASTSSAVSRSTPARSPMSVAGTDRGQASAGAPPSASSFLVHVVGQVHRPGVVRLPAGSRVDDALRAAGGATRSADLALVNLARPVSDGEQIHVPKPGEMPAPPPAAPPAAGSGGAKESGSAASGPVNLNTASEADLDSLPGVGPVLAARIVQWRTTNGRFTSVDDLGEVSGIGDKLLAQLRPLVTV